MRNPKEPSKISRSEVSNEAASLTDRIVADSRVFVNWSGVAPRSTRHRKATLQLMVNEGKESQEAAEGHATGRLDGVQRFPVGHNVERN